MGTAASAALLDLINNIYSTHRLPSVWKRAEIVPIPKPIKVIKSHKRCPLQSEFLSHIKLMGTPV